MTVNQIFDDTNRLLIKTAGLERRKAEVIASNIANLDTPGYQAREFTFTKALQRAAGATPASGLEMRRTNPGHLPAAPALEEVTGTLGMRPRQLGGLDGNSVNLDQEMAEQAINNANYLRTLQMLKSKMAILKNAIVEGGK